MSEPKDQPTLHFPNVVTAMPSPFKPNLNIGTPGDVPHLPGICFPYFTGLIAGDVAFIRKTMANLSFRNFSGPEADAQRGYQAFHSAINTFAYTPEGLILRHIFKGIVLALDMQTQLFCLFDRSRYLGFCLLGDLFAIHSAIGWVLPSDADSLAQGFVIRYA